LRAPSKGSSSVDAAESSTEAAPSMSRLPSERHKLAHGLLRVAGTSLAWQWPCASHPEASDFSSSRLSVVLLGPARERSMLARMVQASAPLGGSGARTQAPAARQRELAARQRELAVETARAWDARIQNPCSGMRASGSSGVTRGTCTERRLTNALRSSPGTTSRSGRTTRLRAEPGARWRAT